jgi:hypothetical protein
MSDYSVNARPCFRQYFSKLLMFTKYCQSVLTLAIAPLRMKPYIATREYRLRLIASLTVIVPLGAAPRSTISITSN